MATTDSNLSFVTIGTKLMINIIFTAPERIKFQILFPLFRWQMK